MYLYGKISNIFKVFVNENKASCSNDCVETWASYDSRSIELRGQAASWSSDTCHGDIPWLIGNSRKESSKQRVPRAGSWKNANFPRQPTTTPWLLVAPVFGHLRPSLFTVSYVSCRYRSRGRQCSEQIQIDPVPAEPVYQREAKNHRVTFITSGSTISINISCNARSIISACSKSL